MSAREVRAGDVLHLTRAASPQFLRPIFVRAIREMVDRHPPYGWTWIEAYELAGPGGQATARRELFVLRTGIRWQDEPAPQARRTAPRRPARVG
ncbi:hypothetical protein [Micromonospora vulcania]|uniref:Uncharacterized protein n=1 Tax=Micromonospora vulcania TaxID=1441873 RepID=A0ABW1HBA6_9ACTN